MNAVQTPQAVKKKLRRRLAAMGRERPFIIGSLTKIHRRCDISKFTKKQIQAIEDWMNNYPRKILDFETAEERFIQEMVA